MSYLKKLTILLQETVDIINREMEIISVTTTGNSHELRVCDVKYAQKGRKVEIDGNEYEITEVQADNGIIVVSGAQPINVTYFELYTVYFFHGTPTEVNQDTTQKGHQHEYTPMIWLNEIFDERPDFDDTSSIENVVSPRIFALGERPNDQKSADLEEEYLDPMRRLMELFVEALRKQTGVFELTEFNPTFNNYAKFGVFISNKGVTKDLFSAHFSGVEMDAQLPIYGKETCCADKCKTETGFLSEDDDELQSQDYDTLIQEP